MAESPWLLREHCVIAVWIHVGETPTSAKVAGIDRSGRGVEADGTGAKAMNNGLHTGCYAVLALDTLDVGIGGLLADRENLTDLPIGFADCYPLQAFEI